MGWFRSGRRAVQAPDAAKPSARRHAATARPARVRKRTAKQDASAATSGAAALKPRSRVRRLALGSIAMSLLLVIVLAITQAGHVAQVIRLRDGDPVVSRFMQREAQRLAQIGRADRFRHEWVPYAAVSDAMKQAVIIAEDARFVDHFGIDWAAIRRAWLTNLARDEIAFGGSTITMQLAKNLYLTGERSYVRKVQEVLIATLLEIALDKQRILELYLNLAQLGDGLFGAQAAARRYFGVDAAQLTPAQAARLAAMLPRPAWFDRNRDSAWLATRSEAIARIAPMARLP